MNSTNLALERPSNEEIYEVLSLSLPRLLPQSLHHIKIPPNSGWPGLALKFQEFKPTYARYELHFSRQSNNHAEYFGKGPVNLAAFYFGYKHPKELRQAWIDEMEIYRDAISSKLEKPIVLDTWGRNWAWIAQGEIDVVGIDLKTRTIYVCEVAIHLITGLQYVKDGRSNNINKLTEKFSRDIEYTNHFFSDYTKHFMLWSPIVKASGANAKYSQMADIEVIKSNIYASYGVTLECIINERFAECLAEDSLEFDFFEEECTERAVLFRTHPWTKIQ